MRQLTAINTPILPASRIREFTPIGELTDAALGDLMGQISVRTISAGAKIFAEGEEDDWSYYLLEGAVELTTHSKHVGTITARSSSSKLPLAPHTPRRETARAKTASTVIGVPRSLLEVLLRPDGASRVELAELGGEHEPIENRLLCRVFEDYLADKLSVPSLPDVALKIREAVSDPDISASRVDRIVTADPAVAARLIQVANSPAYAGISTVESCRDAVTRLGLRTTRDLVTSLLLRELFCTEIPYLKQRMHETWQHSTRVAAICFHVAKAKSGFNPDRALLAGLVHDIGVLPILSRALHYPELCEDPGELANTIEKLRGQFGSMVLRRWGFPADIIACAIEAEDWYRDPAPGPDYCDIVMISQLLNLMGTKQVTKFPAISSLPAFKKLSLGELTPEMTLEILDNAEESIDNLQKMLSGGSDG